MGDYQLKNIPPDLHRRLRIGTVARGTTIRNVIMEALIRFDRSFTEDSSVTTPKQTVQCMGEIPKSGNGTEESSVSPYMLLHPDGVCRHAGTRHAADGSVDCPRLRVKVRSLRSV